MPEQAGYTSAGSPSVQLGDFSAAACEAGTRLSRCLVEFYKSLYGRGPTGVKTVLSAELVVAAMQGVLIPGEQTLVAGGKVVEVEEMRLRTAEITRPRLIARAEEALGVEIAASVTGIRAGDNLVTETFILGPRGGEELGLS